MADERFISPEKPPEGRAREILTILIEECSEVAQRATKMLRFGVNETQPGQDLPNCDRLSREIGDFMVMVHYALAEGLISQAEIDLGKMSKKRQLAKFMQHQESK